jgi:outer membrane receptor protein involved in Fe transport
MKLSAGPASLSLDATWTAPRDLSAYGYGDQYDVYDASTGTASASKRTHAPGFVVVDLQASVRIAGPLEAYVGAQNLLDYTQTVSGSDSPLFWDKDGNYDVSHIWGPLRGRQIYAGLRWSAS